MHRHIDEFPGRHNRCVLRQLSHTPLIVHSEQSSRRLLDSAVHRFRKPFQGKWVQLVKSRALIVRVKLEMSSRSDPRHVIPETNRFIWRRLTRQVSAKTEHRNLTYPIRDRSTVKGSVRVWERNKTELETLQHSVRASTAIGKPMRDSQNRLCCGFCRLHCRIDQNRLIPWLGLERNKRSAIRGLPVDS